VSISRSDGAVYVGNLKTKSHSDSYHRYLAYFAGDLWYDEWECVFGCENAFIRCVSTRSLGSLPTVHIYTEEYVCTYGMCCMRVKSKYAYLMSLI
jgi:hypothetical protein